MLIISSTSAPKPNSPRAHIDGAINVPGGQAVQRADDFVPVRNGRIIFVSNLSARAVMAAYWYGQMGFKHVTVLQGGLEAWRNNGGALVIGVTAEAPLGFDLVERSARIIDAPQLRQLSGAGLLIVDVSTSLEYENGHIPGAKWISRGWIDIKLPELFPDRAQAIVLTCADGRQSTLAARQLAQVGYGDLQLLAGGVRSWTAAGLATAVGLDDCLVKANDVVLSPSIRGNREEMQGYLDWELKLKH